MQFLRAGKVLPLLLLRLTRPCNREMLSLEENKSQYYLRSLWGSCRVKLISIEIETQTGPLQSFPFVGAIILHRCLNACETGCWQNHLASDPGLFATASGTGHLAPVLHAGPRWPTARLCTAPKGGTSISDCYQSLVTYSRICSRHLAQAQRP